MPSRADASEALGVPSSATSRLLGAFPHPPPVPGNKLLAKIGSARNKPNKQTVLLLRGVAPLMQVPGARGWARGRGVGVRWSKRATRRHVEPAGGGNDVGIALAVVVVVVLLLLLRGAASSAHIAVSSFIKTQACLCLLLTL